MKKIVILTLAGGMLLTACSKKEVEPNSTKQATPKPKVQTIQGGDEPYGCYFTFYDKKRPCAPWPINCCVLDEVVIKSGPKGKLQLVAISGNSVSVGEFFSSPDMADIVNNLHPVLAAKLQSGTYSIEMGYDDGTTFNFIAGQGDVSETNFEFAVQLTVQD